MKIAIITFHRALNYGAVLQAFALQKKVSEYCDNVEVLDYSCKALERVYSPFYIEALSIKKIMYMFCSFGLVCKQRYQFSQFLKDNCKISKKKYNSLNVKESDKDYDCFIVGSDQIWNYELTNFDKTYFLDFVKTAKKCSYAASFGFSELEESYKSVYKKLLDQFDYLSVRERQGISIVNELTDKTVVCSLDPVFLLSADEWKKIACKVSHDSGYILVYRITSNDVYKYAEILAKKCGSRIIEIRAPLKQFRNFEKHRIVSIEQFLGWILNAEYIVTDSFHATAFGIIFKKTVKVVLNSGRKNRNSRLTDLLTELKLTHIIIKDDISPEKMLEDDFVCVNHKLDEMRKSSINYIMKILEKEV